MPSKNRYGKPWKAAVKRSGKIYDLGNFDTKEEAIVVEDVFKAANPPKPKAWPEHARKKSVEVRKEKLVTRLEEEKKQVWVRPTQIRIEGDSREARHERARQRALNAF